ncbi:polycystin-2-like [Chrysoperla carnea]|uniref:polycystin-2-like n=1 Tax=Chrysoperla carnea TaxID=189513 RepID=UPI001D090859|nr:polycystin-2-like [Chrysoperla carnea]
MFHYKDDQNYHDNIDKVVYWHVMSDALVGFLLFLSWIKFIRFFFFIRFVYPVISLLQKFLGLLLHYAPLWIIIWSGYAHLGYFWFGNTIYLFRNFWWSFVTLCGVAIGLDDFVEIEEEFFAAFMALFWIGAYYILLQLALTMFLALWMTPPKYKKRLGNEITTLDYLRRGFQNFMSCCRPRKPYASDQVYRHGRIKFGDFRSFLREHNFTKPEINAFMRKFHLNNLGPLTHCTDWTEVIQFLETTSFEPHIPQDFLTYIEKEIHKKMDEMAKESKLRRICTTFPVKQGIRNKMYEIERDVSVMEAKLLQSIKILKLFKELGILQKVPREPSLEEEEISKEDDRKEGESKEDASIVDESKEDERKEDESNEDTY